MRAAWFPKAEDLAGNPYWEILQHELELIDVAFERSQNSYWMSFGWLWKQRKRVDVLHFHFIQPQYAGGGGRVSFRRLAKFATYLATGRLLGYRIVWTMHELLPTWPMPPKWLEMLGRWTIAQLANDVIVHCQEARRLLARHFWRRRRVHVLPLPSYAGLYPNVVPRSQARARLGLADKEFVLAFVGGIRPNKGIEQLIAAFSQLPQQSCVLLIAGRPWPPESYVDKIRTAAMTDSRIRLRVEPIPDEELQLYIKGADALAFPFERVLTSASVMLAMSLGKPVIVPRLGCLPELVGEDAGFVYDPEQPDGLSDALQIAMTADLERMGAAAAQRVNACAWTDLARGTLQVYTTL